MKKNLKTLLYLVPLAVVLALVLGDVMTFAQEFQPPTFLPAEDVDIGGRGGKCIGLADMIRTGNIRLSSIPCFIKYITQTLVGIAGTLAVLFVMIGGYKYIIGRDEDKDAAKKTITYALIGLAVSLMAWILIDVVLRAITE